MMVLYLKSSEETSTTVIDNMHSHDSFGQLFGYLAIIVIVLVYISSFSFTHMILGTYLNHNIAHKCIQLFFYLSIKNIIVVVTLMKITK
jgi:hypothetical protein